MVKNFGWIGVDWGRFMQLTLFDLPPPGPKNLGGRPAFKKTKQNQMVVGRMIRLGHSQPEIAAAIGCSIPTLKLYFSGGPNWQRRWGRKTPEAHNCNERKAR